MTVPAWRLSSSAFWLAIVAVVASLATGSALAQRRPQADVVADLPPVSWTCPMHPEVVQDEKGNCPICQMDTVAVRLDSVWSCPVHSVVAEAAAGKCPICRRELAQMAFATSFTCADDPEVDQIEPGTCRDGTAMIVKRSPRAHGNHSPQHGGGFFMAADNWHHVEGTYPEEGVFRLFVYDDYTKPLAPDRTKQILGRVVTETSFDGATLTENEVTAFPLQAIETGQYLEARIDRRSPPADLVVKVRFTEDGPESRFDFSFPELTKDPVGTAIASASVDPSQLPVEIPNDPQEVIAMLRTRSEQIDAFIQKGAFGQIYVPALQSKDLALALDVQSGTLPAGRRAQVSPAVIELVRSAWLLDAYGDMGNRQQIAAAYVTFAGAVSKLESAFTPGASEAPKR